MNASSGGTVAIIPARGGSKGIPRKNLAPLGGKPLLAHSIEQALASTAIDAVIVSTDDDEIDAVAVAHGARVVRRPAEISGDTASSESALLHVLDVLEDENARPEIVVFLQATSPQRTVADIDRALETFRREGADSLFSAVPLEGFLWRVADDAVASLNYDYRSRPRRQDAPHDVVENGSIYVVKPWVLRQLGNRLGGTIAVHEMGPDSYFQIDEQADLAVMDAIMASRSADGGWPGGDVGALVLDFDGVLTDNAVVVDQEGREAVRCSRSDGMGIARLKASGTPVVVLSSETNPVVERRCAKLGIECIHGCEDKLAEITRLAAKLGVEQHEVCFVGNDVNDLECLRWAGLAVAVADAHPSALEAAGYVTSAPGGRGAVREVCDRILRATGGGDER